MSEKPELTGEDKQQDGHPFTGSPRWVKVSAIIAGVLVLVVVAVMLLSGGEHGPARHGMGTGSPEGRSSLTASGLAAWQVRAVSPGRDY